MTVILSKAKDPCESSSTETPQRLSAREIYAERRLHV